MVVVSFVRILENNALRINACLNNPTLIGTMIFNNSNNKSWSLIKPSLILYFRIPHSTLCLPPKFCINHCFQMLLGICSVPKSISKQ